MIYAIQYNIYLIVLKQKNTHFSVYMTEKRAYSDIFKVSYTL